MSKRKKNQDNLQDDHYNAILKRLNFHRKKSNAQQENEEESSSSNNFITFTELKALAKNGEEFLFIEPDGDAFFSCGDGKCYNGTLMEIREQLESALKIDPENTKTIAGLKKIEQETRNTSMSKQSDTKLPKENNAATILSTANKILAPTNEATDTSEAQQKDTPNTNEIKHRGSP